MYLSSTSTMRLNSENRHLYTDICARFQKSRHGGVGEEHVCVFVVGGGERVLLRLCVC